MPRTRSSTALGPSDVWIRAPWVKALQAASKAGKDGAVSTLDCTCPFSIHSDSNRRGWRAQLLDAGSLAIFDGTDWRAGAMTLSSGGASLNLRVIEMDVAVTTGTSVTTALTIPERAMVFGVTGRVISAITGTLNTWSVGVAGDEARYGSGLGLALNSWVNGPNASQITWSATPLVLTADTGAFAGGTIRLALHCADLTLPDEI